MTLQIYYALWYYTFNNEKSANAISTCKDDLLELHNNSILNPDCYYHKYKKSILKIEVLPIQVYIYKNNQFINSRTLDKDFEEDTFAFYCSYNVYFNNNNNNNNNLEEILIYMSKEDHQIWRTKYEENTNDENDKNAENKISISLNSVNLNEYYEEGIMNA
jgi:hypothetical protein